MKSGTDARNAVNGIPYGYSDAVWRLFNNTPRQGRFEHIGNGGQVISGTAETPASRGVLSLHLKTEAGCVIDARFQAYGCPTTIAVAAWLAEQAVGQRLDELFRLKAPFIRQGLEIPEDRAHCALLGEDAIKAVLANAAGSGRK